MTSVYLSLFFAFTWKTIHSTTAGFLKLLFFFFLVHGFCRFEVSDMSFLSQNIEAKNYTKEKLWVCRDSRIWIDCQFFQSKFATTMSPNTEFHRVQALEDLLDWHHISKVLEHSTRLYINPFQQLIILLIKSERWTWWNNDNTNNKRLNLRVKHSANLFFFK